MKRLRQIMKITTWNVNGIRAALGKGLKEWVITENPDLLCLQEVKAYSSQLTEEQANFPGYEQVWNSAKKPGYSGVATFYKEQPLEINLGLDIPEFDHEGRVICSRHPGFLLFNIYFPNGQRGQERLDYKLNFYSRLLELCDSLHEKGEAVIITGDFNTSHKEIDLRNPKENEKNSGFLPEERMWIDKYLEHGFVDIYRNLYPDKVQYTWWAYRLQARPRNIGWRLDYFLISNNLVKNVREVKIHDDIFGSDHCPVTMNIEL